MGMVGVDKIGEIRRAYFEQDRSIKEIVRTLSVSRATVRKVIRNHKTEFKYARGVQPGDVPLDVEKREAGVAD